MWTMQPQDIFSAEEFGQHTDLKNSSNHGSRSISIYLQFSSYMYSLLDWNKS